MPLSQTGNKIKRAMQKLYGKKRGSNVFYASANKGRVKGGEKIKGYTKVYPIRKAGK